MAFLRLLNSLRRLFTVRTLGVYTLKMIRRKHSKLYILKSIYQIKNIYFPRPAINPEKVTLSIEIRVIWYNVENPFKHICKGNTPEWACIEIISISRIGNCFLWFLEQKQIYFGKSDFETDNVDDIISMINVLLWIRCDANPF